MSNKKSKCDVFILGASGMLGNSLLRYFKNINKYEVIGTIRGSNAPVTTRIMPAAITIIGSIRRILNF